jgi:hypothetical protein
MYLEMHSPSRPLLRLNVKTKKIDDHVKDSCHLDKPHKTFDGPDKSEIERVHRLPHLQCMHADVAYGIIHVISQHAF